MKLMIFGFLVLFQINCSAQIFFSPEDDSGKTKGKMEAKESLQANNDISSEDQDSISLDSHYVKAKEIKDNVDSMDVNINIKIKNLDNVDSLEIRYGCDGSDLVDMKMKHIFINNGEYFQFYDFYYPVIHGNTLFIKGLGRSKDANNWKLLRLIAKDKDGNEVVIVKEK